MINYETILSLFDDKLTLLEYLTKIQKALENEQLTSINVTQTDATHVYFTFVFEDGSTIDTPTFTLPQGAKGDKGDKGDTGEAGTDGADGTSVVSAYINSSSNLILSLSNGHIINCGKIYNGLIKLNVSLSGDIDGAGLTGNLLDSEYEAVIDDTINLVGFTMNYVNFWLVKTYTSTIGGVAILTSIDILEGKDKIIYAEIRKDTDTPTITIKRRKIEGVAIGSKSATSGKVLTADGSGGTSWESISPIVTASNVDSGSETSGKALFTNGSGGASWEQIIDTKINSGYAANGQVLTADGSGGSYWANASGGTTLIRYSVTNITLALLKKIIQHAKGNISGYMGLNVNNTATFLPLGNVSVDASGNMNIRGSLYINDDAYIITCRSTYAQTTIDTNTNNNKTIKIGSDGTVSVITAYTISYNSTNTKLLYYNDTEIT